MADPVYNSVTILDEVRLALGNKTTDAILTDIEIKRFILQNVISESASYTLQELGSTGDYVYPGVSADYGLWLYGMSFTGEDDIEYTVNERGSIDITGGSGTAVEDEYTVTGAVIDFSNVMVQICHWLMTHRAQEIAQSNPAGSITPATIRAELQKIAEHWQGVQGIA